MSLETAQKVIVPQKKNYVPQFLKQRDINSYRVLCLQFYLSVVSQLLWNNTISFKLYWLGNNNQADQGDETESSEREGSETERWKGRV